MSLEWFGPTATVVGAIGGAYLGVRLALVRVERDHAALDAREAEHHKDHGERIGWLEDRL